MIFQESETGRIERSDCQMISRKKSLLLQIVTVENCYVGVRDDGTVAGLEEFPDKAASQSAIWCR